MKSRPQHRADAGTTQPDDQEDGAEELSRPTAGRTDGAEQDSRHEEGGTEECKAEPGSHATDGSRAREGSIVSGGDLR